MSRKALLATLPLIVLLSACKQEDPVLRAWATGIDQWKQALHEWNSTVVFPGLVAYCELEAHVYDTLHAGEITPVNRYCPPGGTDPILPPTPPPGWDD
jgi:hypothetical protein